MKIAMMFSFRIMMIEATSTCEQKDTLWCSHYSTSMVHAKCSHVAGSFGEQPVLNYDEKMMTMMRRDKLPDWHCSTKSGIRYRSENTWSSMAHDQSLAPQSLDSMIESSLSEEVPKQYTDLDLDQIYRHEDLYDSRRLHIRLKTLIS
jgi:hypothetical protein